MKRIFIPCSEINETIKKIVESAKNQNANSVLCAAIHKLVGFSEYFVFAKYGTFANFKSIGKKYRDYDEETFGLCIFDSRSEYFTFLDYVDNN